MKYSAFLESTKPGGSLYAYGVFLRVLYQLALRLAQLTHVAFFICLLIVMFPVPEVLVGILGCFWGGGLTVSALLLGLLIVLVIPLAWQDCAPGFGFLDDLSSFIESKWSCFVDDSLKPLVYLCTGILLGVFYTGRFLYKGVSALVRGITSYFTHAKSLYDPVRLNAYHNDPSLISSDVLSAELGWEPLVLSESDENKDIKCPITLNVLKDLDMPVRTETSNGIYHYFEKSAILQWIASNGTHPVTRETLTIGDLVPVILPSSIIASPS